MEDKSLSIGDSYGAPAAPPVGYDSYGAPAAPIIDSYGAPAAPVVDEFGSPHAAPIEAYHPPAHAPANAPAHAPPSHAVYHPPAPIEAYHPPAPPAPIEGYQNEDQVCEIRWETSFDELLRGNEIVQVPKQTSRLVCANIVNQQECRNVPREMVGENGITETVYEQVCGDPPPTTTLAPIALEEEDYVLPPLGNYYEQQAYLLPDSDFTIKRRNHLSSTVHVFPLTANQLTPPQVNGPARHQLRPRIDKSPKNVLEEINSTLLKLGREAYAWNASMFSKISSLFL